MRPRCEWLARISNPVLRHEQKPEVQQAWRALSMPPLCRGMTGSQVPATLPAAGQHRQRHHTVEAVAGEAAGLVAEGIRTRHHMNQTLRPQTGTHYVQLRLCRP
jgi:hypothetical protein